MIALVDTSIWSLALRRKRHLLSAEETRRVVVLEEIIAEGRARLAGPVRQELLSGIRHAEQFVGLREYLRSFPDVPLYIEDYERAAELRNTCQQHGIIGSPIDFLLCSIAIDRSWAIYTGDRDFERYARHIPITLLD